MTWFFSLLITTADLEGFGRFFIIARKKLWRDAFVMVACRMHEPMLLSHANCQFEPFHEKANSVQKSETGHIKLINVKRGLLGSKKGAVCNGFHSYVILNMQITCPLKMMFGMKILCTGT